MHIIDFTREHITNAKELALSCYKEEQSKVPVLPKAEELLDLTYFADNGFGAAAYEGKTMIGFLCGTEPFDHAFGSTDAKGIFSPMGANAAAAQNRADIYAAMYQYAAQKWVRAGAVSHGVCLYAHDEAAQQQFFRYGFGQRCADAVRAMEPISCIQNEKYEKHSFENEELDPETIAQAYPLEVMLNRHYESSPFFMNRTVTTCQDFCSTFTAEKERCFITRYKGQPCAYLKISESGETCITENREYLHITAAYCLTEHRGKGVIQNLLNYAVNILKKEGYAYLGVDYESLNPTAYAFWQKYFSVYTHGLVRRIDERILMAPIQVIL